MGTLNFEQRKIIFSLLAHGSHLNEIAKILSLDPTSISKEIKRNCFQTKEESEKKSCRQAIRYPYCCNHCSLKYSACHFTQYKYDAKSAEEKANHRLKCSRVGIDVEQEDY